MLGRYLWRQLEARKTPAERLARRWLPGWLCWLRRCGGSPLRRRQMREAPIRSPEPDRYVYHSWRGPSHSTTAQVNTGSKAWAGAVCPTDEVALWTGVLIAYRGRLFAAWTIAMASRHQCDLASRLNAGGRASGAKSVRDGLIRYRGRPVRPRLSLGNRSVGSVQEIPGGAAEPISDSNSGSPPGAVSMVAALPGRSSSSSMEKSGAGRVSPPRSGHSIRHSESLRR